MARVKGLVPCSVNFEVNKTAPLDSRSVIDTKAELTLTATWADSNNGVWLYDGLVVAVKEDNSLYMLIGQEADPTAYTSISNWHQIDAAAAKVNVINNLTSDSTTEPLAAAQGKALNEKIDGALEMLSSVYSYQGSVATYDELPSGGAVGDVYNVEAAHGNFPAGTNYAWDGENWDALGGSVDLSGYYDKSQVNATIDQLKQQLTEKIDAVEATANSNAEALVIVNGDASTAGSLANTLKSANDYTDTQLTNYVQKQEGSSLISSEKLALIDTNASNITALEERVEANEAALGILNGTGNGSVKKTADDAIAAALEWQELN